MKRLLLAAALTISFAGAARADGCTDTMTKFDDAITYLVFSDIPDEQIDKATSIYDEGFKLHKTGRHEEAKVTLEKAFEVLVADY